MSRREENPLPNEENGNSKLGFLITSPDPEIPAEKIQETPDYIRRGSRKIRIAPVELFSERCPDATKSEWGLASTIQEPLNRIHPSEDYLNPKGTSDFQDSILSINSGGGDDSIVCSGINFQRDDFYTGGDIISTDVKVGDSKEGIKLYQSARIGDFSYKFPNLEPGDYLVDLYLAEIVFTNGPPGMRIFDVFIQGEKVASSIDIYSRVGSNHPLTITDLKASVVGQEGLLIKFEGVVGRPIVCGISIRRDSSDGLTFEKQLAGNIVMVSGKTKVRLDMDELEAENESCSDCKKLKEKYDLLFKEQLEVKGLLEDVKRENEVKSRECHKAWTSLQELQMELMRKSMHVGSLAFAVEGQVKEKSRWFLSLGNLSEKFQLLKLEHAKLSEEAVEYRNCLTEMAHMTSTIQSTVDRHLELEREYKDLKVKFAEEAKERKDLYNKFIELKGNIRVFCRCRPLNSEEIAAGATMAIDFESAKDEELTVKSSHGAFKKVFKFDSVFSPEEDQQKVFEKTSPLAISVLDGYNVCIFAYGQTGTGKTFTMEGTEEARGVNYRTLDELFRVTRERQGQFRYEITVSVLEVYNEQIHDLLQSGTQPGAAAKRLEVRQVAEGVHHVPGLVEAHVSNMNEVWEALQTGSKARAVGSTNANEHSSRSHCITCVMVKGENLMNGECTRSKLWLIDLAGSERVAKTDVQGERLKEAQSINKSLSALGDVISALATKSPHIPFRNSKLTHLLQDSLGGDSKTLMFVQISPNENDVGETLCSLNFASRVRGIELGPAKKQVDGYKQMVEKAKQEIKNKDGQIKKMEETIHSLEFKSKAKDLINKNLQEKIKELESQLLIERKLARQHVDTKIVEDQLQQQQQRKQQEQPNASLFTPVSRPFLEKNYNYVAQQATFKDLGNEMQLFAENNSKKPVTPPSSDNNIYRCLPIPKDKENDPEAAEEPSYLTKARRDSLCTSARRISLIPTVQGNPLIPPTRKANRATLCAAAAHSIPIIPASRRNSLIPIPAEKSAAAVTPLLPPLTCTTGNLLPPLPSPFPDISNTCEGTKKSGKKLNSILRRSLQKKVIIRSPFPQTTRRGNTLAGMEKMRVSIGGSGRMARRVMLRDGSTRAADRGVQHRQQEKKNKERGWNNGTAGRNLF